MSRCLLYYITDRKAFAEDEPTRRRMLLEKIGEAARCGVDYIQLREKDLSSRELESLARKAIEVVRENAGKGTALLINSRTDVALAVGADGVHLPSGNVSPEVVRRTCSCSAGTLARELSTRAPLIGVSCHSDSEVAQAAAEKAGFVVFAPVFEKKSVPGVAPTGLATLREACAARIPVLALGGITLGNAQSCLDAGAAGIAAIRLFQENDLATLVPILRRL